MIPAYYVVNTADNNKVEICVRPATKQDFLRTAQDHWQTDWRSDYIQQEELEKFAFEISDTHELIGLGAYRDLPEGVLVYVEYIESAPHSNPTIDRGRKYRGIGAMLLAYGIQLSIDYGYGGAIYLKAKTSEIRKHYIEDFEAIPFSRIDPYLLLIDGDAAEKLFSQYLKEE